MGDKNNYNAATIKVLEGLEAVRKRPGMYIGSTGTEGLHHLIREVVDNCIDEFIMGYGDEMNVSLLPNNKVKISDNGRGIPVDIHKKTGKSAIETVLTILHAGGKFGGNAYKASGGLHGVGISVVNALSEHLKVDVFRDGYQYTQEYQKGKPLYDLKKNKTEENKRGTTIIFEPDPKIFEIIEFDFDKILNYLRQQAYLNKKIKISFIDKRDKNKYVELDEKAEQNTNNKKIEQKYIFYFENGIKSYINYLIKNSKPKHNHIFYIIGKKNDIQVEIAFQYTQEFEVNEKSFVNNVFTINGGTHLTGFRTALTRTLNDYAKKNNFIKTKDNNLSGEDVREGITAIISVKIQEPQFEGQTKSKLGTVEAKGVVEQILGEGLNDYLEKNPQDAKIIIENSMLAQRARKMAQMTKDNILRKGILEGLSLPGKLADCTSKIPENSEIFIVEGDSAGGCFFGDTRVALASGQNLSFRQLVKEDKKGKKNYCYTIKKDGTIGIRLIENPRKTKTNTEVIKVVLDNAEEIICTPDHKFMLTNREYKMAKDLTTKDSLMPLYKKYSRKQGRITIDGYEMIFDPQEKKWIFTHLLADNYNLKNRIYLEKNGCDKHHIDFNKLNNNPDNIKRIPKKEHLEYHCQMLKFGLHREDVKEKARKSHQLKEYREKISKIMSTPKMKKMLSERAKKQWENKEYKQYMIQKFLEFYKNNKKYREKNNKLLFENQKKYWNSLNNRRNQSKKIEEYFEKYPEKKKELSIKAKKQWQDKELLEWRKNKTKQQWNLEFRIKRKKAYNRTYQERSLKLMKKVYEQSGQLDKEKYNQERLKINDKSILKLDTICQRFFENDENKFKEAVLNYNHKIRKIIKLKKKIDVYDLEVGETHNFALASGIFVHNSSKQARDRHTQAILPLKGKILNVERARRDKVLSSKEIRALIIALGTSIAEDFNLEKIRYHKIIITCDADTDGKHIGTLILTLFYRYFRKIIEKGYLYMARPPLYQIKFGKTIKYVYTDEEKEKILETIKDEKINIQRYKGLGEMNPDQLWETTMDPEKRVLYQIKIEDIDKTDQIFDILMGEEVFPRKKFIQSYAKTAQNIDI